MSFETGNGRTRRRLPTEGRAKGDVMIKGFKEFILRGNVIDLAVAVVIGAAFGAVITAFVADIITPLIAAIFGQPDFSGLTLTINKSKFLYGSFINAVVSFVLIAAAVYFLVVVPMNKIAERRARGQAPADATTKACPECLSEIPVAARRCAFCASEQHDVAVA
jgi:large conductance mechanosensitive channel